MVKFTAAVNYATKHKNRDDFLHSSGYAKVQNGGAVGAAGGESFAERRAIDEQRKYVQGYKNARITNEFYGIRRARNTYANRGRTEVAQAGGTRGGEAANRGAQNPMDRAMDKARFSASTGVRGAGATGVKRIGQTARGTQIQARAPQVPNRRAGI